jgi:non-ribosomal peptide synthetase component E (peptide arylation enzyme)
MITFTWEASWSLALSSSAENTASASDPSNQQHNRHLKSLGSNNNYTSNIPSRHLDFLYYLRNSGPLCVATQGTQKSKVKYHNSEIREKI